MAERDIPEVPSGTWLTTVEVETFCDVLQMRGYRVSANELLDSVTNGGCFAHLAVLRARAIAPELSREEAVELVEGTIGARRTA